METSTERGNRITRRALERVSKRAGTLRKYAGPCRRPTALTRKTIWTQESARLYAGVRARLESLREVRLKSASRRTPTQVSGRGLQRLATAVDRGGWRGKTKLTDYRNALVMEHMGKIKSKARRWRHKVHMLGDDAESLCIMGLIDAAKHYIPTYQGFWKYASMRIDGTVRDYMRREDWVARIDRKKHKDDPDFVIHEQIHINAWASDEGLDIYQQLAAEDVRFKQIEDREQARKILRGLSRQEARVVQLYVIDGYTMREIGVIMGLSESRICQVWQQILEYGKRRVR